MKNSTNSEIFAQDEHFQCKNKPISKKNLKLQTVPPAILFIEGLFVLIAKTLII